MRTRLHDHARMAKTSMPANITYRQRTGIFGSNVNINSRLAFAAKHNYEYEQKKPTELRICI